MEGTQYVGRYRPIRPGARRLRESTRELRHNRDRAKHRSRHREVRRNEAPRSRAPGGRARRRVAPGVYRKRRRLALVLLLAGTLTVIFAVAARSSQAAQPEAAIDPGAAPGAVLARAAGVEISTPIHPADLTGIGYHPDGESLVEMEPRGASLSSNPLSRFLSGGSTREDIRYHTMDRAERVGSATGALDVGAGAGAPVYSPVTGVVTAIRPDPLVNGANLVEIQSSENPNLRVYVSLVRNISPGTGVESHVRAGKTRLGVVADSARVLDPQLSSYTGTAGNHVTVAASRVD